MSLRFSRVTAVHNGTEVTFLVSGIPENQSDLAPWTEYKRFIATVVPGHTIYLHVETFLYGDDDPVDATPEEIAYFYYRIKFRPDFIEARTRMIAEKDISITI